MKREVTQEQYNAIWNGLLDAVGADKSTVFEVAFTPTGAVVRNVRYTQQPNGTMSGEFWNDQVAMKAAVAKP